MTKTAKIATAVSVCVVVLAVLFGCLFGIKCTITFDYGYNAPNTYGTDSIFSLYGKSNPPTTQVTRFSKYAPDRPTRSGYTFEGWYKDTACTIPWDNSAVSGDMTLYAKWTKI